MALAEPRLRAAGVIQSLKFVALDDYVPCHVFIIASFLCNLCGMFALANCYLRGASRAECKLVLACVICFETNVSCIWVRQKSKDLHFAARCVFPYGVQRFANASPAPHNYETCFVGNNRLSKIKHPSAGRWLLFAIGAWLAHTDCCRTFLRGNVRKLACFLRCRYLHIFGFTFRCALDCTVHG